MLTLQEASRVVDAAVRSVFEDKGLSRVSTRDIADAQGRDALKVTIVFDNVDVEGATGDHALDALVRIQTALENAGDPRFGYVEYATEQDLAEEAAGYDDPEL